VILGDLEHRMLRHGAEVALLSGLLSVALVSARLRTAALYLFVFLLAAVTAFAIYPLCYGAFLLGAMTASGEIIAKFRDDPLKAFRTTQAALYHGVNGAISAVALGVLSLYQVPMDTPLDQVKAVITAGLGAALLLRSKLFTIRIGNEDVAFGPDQLVKVFFRFMEQAIDRVRAQARIDFVRSVMNNVDPEKVRTYSSAMTECIQTTAGNDRQELQRQIEEVCLDGSTEKQVRAYRLGFLLLNQLGENVVARIFSDPPPEWRIRAPLQDEGGLLARLFTQSDGTVPYFAYSQNMSRQQMLQRLGWHEEDASRVHDKLAPKAAVLPGYRLVFADPRTITASRGALATIVPDSRSTVEGVVYRLPLTALRFLDTPYDPGYRRITVTVEAAGERLEAQTYIGESTRVGKPTRPYVDTMIAGAIENGVSRGYIDALRRVETCADTTLSSRPVLEVHVGDGVDSTPASSLAGTADR
jgi:hypothetical protein